MAPSEPQRNIVIIGGGIIGCTTAYYLSDHPAFSASTVVTILEASKVGVAQGASGKAGGLVAKWAYPRELVDVSFTEHVRLAQEHDGATRWGWRYTGVGSWEGRGSASIVANTERKSLEKTTGLEDNWKTISNARKMKRLPNDLTWVHEHLTDGYSPMAKDGDTAQVHPRLFTNSMFELAKERGVRFVQGRATAIERADGRVSGVSYVPTGPDATGDKIEVLPATQVVVSAGAWSLFLLPTLPIRGTRAHSITIQTKPSVSIAPYALFTEITYTPAGSQRASSVSPEIYSRPGGEMYACGPGDSSPLPHTVDDVECDADACEAIHGQVTSISDEMRDGEVTARQACFLPVVSTGGGPIVGEATKIAKGLIVATGHTCWGICNAPATAKAVSELIMDGKILCTDLKKLNPSKYLM